MIEKINMQLAIFNWKLMGIDESIDSGCLTVEQYYSAEIQRNKIVEEIEKLENTKLRILKLQKITDDNTRN